LLNAVILLIAVGGIAWEAIRRFSMPSPIASGTVIIIAIAGIVINSATAWLFFAGRDKNLNIRGAFLHMAADAGVSLGGVVAGFMILMIGWEWLDPKVQPAPQTLLSVRCGGFTAHTGWKRKPLRGTTSLQTSCSCK
jgi:cobalt-zinc-cadmium efflux system protein